MKLSLSLLFAAFLVLSGCEKIKDATSIKVDTSFNVDFPVTTNQSKATASTFSQTEVLSLADNSDLESYLSRIDEIDLSNVVITVEGLTEGQTINTLSLSAEGIGTILTVTDITMANNSFTPEVSSSILTQMGNKLNSNGSLTFTVSGETSGPMTFVVSAGMDAKVKVETL
jgi:hypothetical protein